jgi:hypothetical protein
VGGTGVDNGQRPARFSPRDPLRAPRAPGLGCQPRGVGVSTVPTSRLAARLSFHRVHSLRPGHNLRPVQPPLGAASARGCAARPRRSSGRCPPASLQLRAPSAKRFRSFPAPAAPVVPGTGSPPTSRFSQPPPRPVQVDSCPVVGTDGLPWSRGPRARGLGFLRLPAARSVRVPLGPLAGASGLRKELGEDLTVLSSRPPSVVTVFTAFELHWSPSWWAAENYHSLLESSGLAFFFFFNLREFVPLLSCL